jgi:hypothetical protein
MHTPQRSSLSQLTAALMLCACTGNIEGDTRTSGSSLNGASGSDASGGLGNAGGGPGASAPGVVGPPANPERDVNRVAIHRLNNAEYDHTVRDLLGVDQTPARTFIADEKALGFDTIADALGMTEAQYEQYWNAAIALAETVFQDPALRARIMTCAPAGPDDRACTESIVASFGRRALRRPPTAEERERLVALAEQARARGEAFDASIALVVRALLSSVGFLYRVELDADPTSPVAHPLTDYELASRLSYLLWSTMPDDALLDAAERGELQQDAELAAQLERLLEDPRSERFVGSFAGQWLGMRSLQSHQVDADAFPAWDQELRDAMIREGLRYFDQFLHGDRSFGEFFTADVSFVDAPLAELYGFDGDDFDPDRPLSVTSDARRGFLGLASFLTLTSFSHRTAPTLRGKWVLESLLCQSIPPPPPDVPELEGDSGGADAESLNVRERLAMHRENPACAGCHTTLDPIGLGLESFDAIGRHRTSYTGGDPIDATGELPSGERFDGLLELSALLADDPRLSECVTEKLVTYALSRKLVDSDQPHLDELRQGFVAGGSSLRGLLRAIVLSEPFRYRRGEPAP